MPICNMAVNWNKQRHLPTMVEGTIVAICQHGGEFVTKSDGSLSYSGGEALAVVVGHDMLSVDFKSEIASTFDIDISGMSIKYFLPSNRRVLITRSNDKDLRRTVSYNVHAMSTEMYILNKVDSRSTVGDLGTRIAAAEQGVKWKRSTYGARATRTRLRAADSGTPMLLPLLL